jgi:Arc/MetJ-type ribon-helix-helix transcriptional regulator
MRTTQQLSITLSNEMADVIKAKVRAGELESAPIIPPSASMP